MDHGEPGAKEHGSIAIVERFIKTMKDEFLRRIFVPSNLPRMYVALSAFQVWYNQHRPHASLRGRTPAEVCDARFSARDKPRLETRTRIPLARGDPTKPIVLQRRLRGRLDLVVTYLDGHAQLPLVALLDAV